MAFPARISDVTVEWLNEALLASGTLRSSRVASFEVKPGPGKGGTSSIHLLALSYTSRGDGAPASMIAKFSSENETVRNALRDYGFYQHEVEFYSRHGADPGIPIPACHASGYNAADNTCFLLLEHLANARCRDVYEGEPWEIEAAVRILAPFHAKWWGCKSLTASIGDEYSPAALKRRAENATRAFVRIRDNHRGETGESFFGILELWVGHFQKLADIAKSRPMTMCHGSLHRGQILFTESRADHPRVIDWQNVSMNFGANDLARLMVTGLTPAQRQGHERRFIDIYFSLLQSSGITGYSKKDFLDDYRMGVVNLIVFHSLMLADYSAEVIAKHWDGPESFWETLFRWPDAAARDFQALEWLRETLGPGSKVS